MTKFARQCIVLLVLFQSRDFDFAPAEDLADDLEDEQDETIVTPHDLVRISRVIPASKWREILVEGFGFTENEIDRAQYNNIGEELEDLLSTLLVEWLNRQDPRPSKRDLYWILRDYQTYNEFSEILQIGQTNDRDQCIIV